MPVRWIEVGDITALGVTQASHSSFSLRPLSPALRQLSMSFRASTDQLLGDVDINAEYTRSSHTDNFDSCSAERRREIEKSLLRKLDLRVSFLVLIWLMNIVGCPDALVPWLLPHHLSGRQTEYSVGVPTSTISQSFMHHRNSSAARLNGFEEDLQLTGRQFNTLISTAYVGQLFMQIPS